VSGMSIFSSGIGEEFLYGTEHTKDIFEVRASYKNKDYIVRCSMLPGKSLDQNLQDRISKDFTKFMQKREK